MTEADIIAMTYEDICTISRLDDIENPETGITEQGYVSIHKNVPCALSQGQLDGLAVIEGNDMVNIATDEYKLFLRPEVSILRGDQILVIQKASNTSFELYATKPFYYPSHCEVGLTGRELNG
ncbi:TPA: hypothetical protein ACWWCX_002700 [Enterococcus faecium]